MIFHSNLGKFIKYVPQGPNIINLSYITDPPPVSSKLKIKEGFEWVIQIWTRGRQFEFIKFGLSLRLYPGILG